MTVVYGIKNCDTVRKARRWLEAQGVDYEFHDLRADGLSQTKLKSWIKAVDWEVLLNRRGTTWRKLPEDKREDMSGTRAIRLMFEYPTLIKRPVIEHGKHLLVGFDEDVLKEHFVKQ